MKHSKNHSFRFIQNGGLVQAKISTIEDVLNLKNLDKKMWTALACPVQGLEFSEETLSILDTDKNGRVRAQEILDAVDYIKKYFSKPEIIMEKGSTIPLDSLSTQNFDCGSSPIECAKTILSILGKKNATEISLEDLAANDKLFAKNIFNGDGVLTVECATDEKIQKTIQNIIDATNGSDDVSGAKGISKNQAETFFSDANSILEWQKSATTEKSEVAYKSYIAVKDKIDDFFLRTSLGFYDENAKSILKEKAESSFLDENGNLQDLSHLALLPLSFCETSDKDVGNDSDSDNDLGGKRGAGNIGGLGDNGNSALGAKLFLKKGINPAWKEKLDDFNEKVLSNSDYLSQEEWNKIKNGFSSYENWILSKPQNSATNFSIEYLSEIINNDTKEKIDELFAQEENCPPIAQASIELKKMLLLRRDFVELLKNFVSFEEFYTLGEKAIFQCGTLFIDGKECELCVKVLDSAKHSTMASLSQCYLVYCDCVKRGTEANEKMQIAALISNGEVDNIIIGRNGIFYDRNGGEWDATVVKIIENPINIKQAFLSPYKKLLRLIQERIAKSASEKEKKVNSKLSSAVENPKLNTTLDEQPKKIDIGTIAALSVTFTGIATVVGGILNAFFGLGWWIPVGILGIILAISLPSMILAYLKLRQRNIAPILDASGWAINANTKISTILGRSLTHIPHWPKGSFLNKKDPFASKKFPWKRVIFAIIIVALVVCAIVLIAKNPDGISGVWQNIKTFFSKFKIQSVQAE